MEKIGYQAPITITVKSDIANAVAAGMAAFVPEREIAHCGWSGTEYVLVDPATGAGAYLLEGGSMGFSTTVPRTISPVVSDCSDILGYFASQGYASRTFSGALICAKRCK